ncbi:MAG: 2-pyrone-4,6-dicarboxylate lactonase [Alphaproteobacteria bacterium]|nr:2-pyrone-4,6-dicarboxylate lactonase [Alphaproteobacteria bacterium]
MTLHGKPMSAEPTCPPPDPNPTRPHIKLPPLSCDSQFHIFGPAPVFPYAAQRAFTPHDAPKERLFALHQFLGFERGIFVQSSCHGTDHAAVLDALRDAKGRYRGVALLAPETPAQEVARLNDAGFCGVRFHFLPHLGAAPSYDAMRSVMRLIAPHGWHVAIHVTGKDLLAHLDFINSIEARVVIDHIARLDVTEGVGGAAFTALRRLLDGGRVWVKLSGTDRVSKQAPPFRDAVALARALAEHAPERVVWGTDWPHPNIDAHMPNDGQLVDSIAEIAPAEATRRRMLVDNPAELFGF